MRSSLPHFPPRLVATFCIALGCKRGFGTSAAGVEGEKVLGAAVEFHAAAGGFGDFLTKADVVEAGFHIDHAVITCFRYSMRL